MEQLTVVKHIKNTIGMGLGRTISQVLNIIFLPIILGFITPSDYGVYSLLQIICLIIGVIMSFGLSTAFMAKYRDCRDDSTLVSELLSVCVTVQLLLGVVIIIFVVPLTSDISIIITGDDFGTLIILLIIKEFFAINSLIFNRWQMLTGRVQYITIISIIRSSINLSISFLLVAIFRLGITGLALAELLAEIIVFSSNLIIAFGKFKLSLRKVSVVELLKLGLPASPDTIFFWIIISAPMFFLRKAGLNDLSGYFSLAWKIASPVDVLGNSLATGAGNKLLYSSISSNCELKKLYRFSFVVLLFASITIGIFAPEILVFFFSGDYHPAMISVPFTILGNFFLSLYYFEWIGLSGSKNTMSLSISSFLGAAIGVVGYLLMNGHLSAFTTAIMFALSLFIMWLVARILRPGVKYGNLLILLGLCLLSSLIIFIFINTDSMSILTSSVKIVFLCLLFAMLSLYELYARAKAGGDFKYINIPTYKVASKLIRNEDILLDVGCSEGFLLKDLVASYRVGIDVDFERLIQGKSTNPTIDFVCGDGTALPFKNDTFSKIIMIGSFPYINDPIEALSNCYRTLNTGGKITLTTATDHKLYRIISVAAHKSGVHYYKKNEVKTYFENCGFTVESSCEKGRIISPILSSLYSIPSIIDRKIIKAKSIIGPLGRWSRWLTNQLIDWEYENIPEPGYQLFLTASKRING